MCVPGSPYIGDGHLTFSRNPYRLVYKPPTIGLMTIPHDMEIMGVESRPDRTCDSVFHRWTPPPPKVTAIIPDRGFRVGGTNVTIVTSALEAEENKVMIFEFFGQTVS